MRQFSGVSLGAVFAIVPLAFCGIGITRPLNMSFTLFTLALVPAPSPSLRVRLPALFGALSALPQLAGWDDAALMARLADEPAALALELRRRFTGRAGRGLVGADGARLLLFVDQLEELLTQAEPAEARLFSEALGAVVAAAPGVRLLASARSDFLTRLSGLPGLGPPLPRALHLISPLSEDGLRQAVVQPALAKGFRFETPALVDALVAAATDEGGLPLLQFALSALWEARDEARRLIPAAALAALGGVSGALAEHADRVFFGLPPPEQRAARRLLSRLVSVEGVRLRQPERALCDGAKDAKEEDGQVPEGAAQAALEALTRGCRRCSSRRSWWRTRGTGGGPGS